MTLLPGDVLAVRTPDVWGRFIRFGGAFKELVTGSAEPNLDNHIAVVHHVDEHGTLWVIEGKPGGVGWRAAGDYLTSRWTIDNSAQPKTPPQRAAIVTTMRAMVGTAYDWTAIAEDAGLDFGLKDIWHENADGVVPGHVVCSSLAAYAYDKNKVKAPIPADYKHVEPADWAAFIIEKAWT